MFIPILQVRKQRLGNSMEFAQGHRDSMGWSWALNPGLHPKPELGSPDNASSETMNYTSSPLHLSKLPTSFGTKAINLPRESSPKRPGHRTLLPLNSGEAYCPYLPSMTLFDHSSNTSVFDASHAVPPGRPACLV